MDLIIHDPDKHFYAANISGDVTPIQLQFFQDNFVFWFLTFLLLVFYIIIIHIIYWTFTVKLTVSIFPYSHDYYSYVEIGRDLLSDMLGIRTTMVI